MNNWYWIKFVIGLALGVAVGPLVLDLVGRVYDSLRDRVDGHRQNEAKFK